MPERADLELRVLEGRYNAITYGSRTVSVRELPWQSSIAIFRELVPLWDKVIDAIAAFQVARSGQGISNFGDLISSLAQVAPDATNNLVMATTGLSEDDVNGLPFHMILIIVEQAIYLNFIDNSDLKDFTARLLSKLPREKAEETPSGEVGAESSPQP